MPDFNIERDQLKVKNLIQAILAERMFGDKTPDHLFSWIDKYSKAFKTVYDHYVSEDKDFFLHFKENPEAILKHIEAELYMEKAA